MDGTGCNLRAGLTPAVAILQGQGGDDGARVGCFVKVQGTGAEGRRWWL